MCVSCSTSPNPSPSFHYTRHHVGAFQKTNLITREQPVETCGRKESEGWVLSDAASFSTLLALSYIPPYRTEISFPYFTIKNPFLPTNFPLIPRIEKSRVFRMPLLNHFQVVNDVA